MPPLDYGPLQAMLLVDGWEVQAELVIRAQRAGAWGVWQLVIDRGGRLRFVQTRFLRPEQSRRVTRAGRRYRLLRQEEERLTIACQIGGVEELRGFLDDLPALLQVHWQDNDVIPG